MKVNASKSIDLMNKPKVTKSAFQSVEAKTNLKNSFQNRETRKLKTSATRKKKKIKSRPSKTATDESNINQCDLSKQQPEEKDIVLESEKELSGAHFPHSSKLDIIKTETKFELPPSIEDATPLVLPKMEEENKPCNFLASPEKQDPKLLNIEIEQDIQLKFDTPEAGAESSLSENEIENKEVSKTYEVKRTKVFYFLPFPSQTKPDYLGKSVPPSFPKCTDDYQELFVNHFLMETDVEELHEQNALLDDILEENYS